MSAKAYILLENTFSETFKKKKENLSLNKDRCTDNSHNKIACFLTQESISTAMNNFLRYYEK